MRRDKTGRGRRGPRSSDVESPEALFELDDTVVVVVAAPEDDVQSDADPDTAGPG